MLKKLMFAQGRRICRVVAATAAIMFVLICARPCAAQEPAAGAVITDRAMPAASTRFGVPNQFKLAGAGNVLFTSGGNTALFRWSESAGRQRLMQTNDPLAKLAIPDLPTDGENEGALVDVTGGLLQANAGYAAFVASGAVKGNQDPSGPMVYDGSSYRLLRMSLSTFSQLLLNASGQVAVLGFTGYYGVGAQRIEVGRISDRVLVAESNRPAPPSVGGTYGSLQLIGFNDAGWVAFLADIVGSSITTRAVFLSDNGAPPVLVVKRLDPAPGANGGTFNLRQNAGSYMLNNAGDVAFVTDINGAGGHPGIWIGGASRPPAKLMRLADPAESSFGGNFSALPTNAVFALRGFNDAGQVLFSSNFTAEGSNPSHALFLKDLSSAAQVVFSRGQSAGSSGKFDMTQQAALSNSGKVAFLASLTGGSTRMGWFLGSGASEPVKIAAQGDSTPLGGTFGLAGRNAPAQIDDGNQVLFLADVLDPNATGLFYWTEAGGVKPVVTSRDSLPEGANPVMRAETTAASDTETLVRTLNAGGQAAWYSAPLATGTSELRKIVAEFDEVPDAGTVIAPSGFSMNGKGEVVFMTTLLRRDFYPRAGILANRPASGLEKAVLAGDPAPGGGTFTMFAAPQINNQTQVAFHAFANVETPAGTTAGPGIFIGALERPLQLQTVVRAGAPWPGRPDTFNNFNPNVAVNDSGQVAFRGNGAGGSAGVFVGTGGGTPVKVIQNGDSVSDGVTVNGVPSTFKLNAAGQVAYSAGVAGGGKNRGVFLGTPGESEYTREALAMNGDPAPGASATFAAFRDDSVDLNSSGQVAFWAGLNPPTAGAGWFLGSAAASLSSRLLQNQPLPGGGRVATVAPGIRFAVLADSGEMAIYVGGVTGGGEEPQFVIAGADGALRKFAVSTEKAEGTGSEFAKLYPTLAATPSGKFLFGAVLVNGPVNAGVFINKP